MCFVDVVRDLGVVVDSHLTFSKHIATIVTKGHLRANQILRTFLSKDVSVTLKAFLTYVRPLVEYCSPVWSPCTAALVNKVEAVQRRFTKRLDGLNNLSYDERCFRLKIDRLELRRLRIDLITCFKILHGLISLSSGDFFSIVSNRSTRGNSYKLFLPDSRVDSRKHFFRC